MTFAAALPLLAAAGGTAAGVGAAGAGFSTLAALSLGATAGGALLQTGGAFMAARGQQQAARYESAVAAQNARVAELRAADQAELGRLEELRARQRTAQVIGRQRAGLASLGVDLSSGSPLDLVSDTAALGELDAQIVRANAERAAWSERVRGMGFQAEGALASARARWSSPWLPTATTLLSGAGQVADRWYRLSKGPGLYQRAVSPYADPWAPTADPWAPISSRRRGL